MNKDADTRNAKIARMFVSLNHSSQHKPVLDLATMTESVIGVNHHLK